MSAEQAAAGGLMSVTVPSLLCRRMSMVVPMLRLAGLSSPSRLSQARLVAVLRSMGRAPPSAVRPRSRAPPAEGPTHRAAPGENLHRDRDVQRARRAVACADAGNPCTNVRGGDHLLLTRFYHPHESALAHIAEGFFASAKFLCQSSQP